MKTIEHVTDMGVSALKMTYSYNNRDLPTLIVETSVLGGPMATVTFIYDDRGRLTSEQRAGDNPYVLIYAYDLGGNRRKKTDVMAETEVIYEYDIDDALGFGTANNRLMTESLLSTAGMASTLLSTKYYYYTFAGNVERVVTELASPGNGVPKF